MSLAKNILFRDWTGALERVLKNGDAWLDSAEGPCPTLLDEVTLGSLLATSSRSKAWKVYFEGFLSNPQTHLLTRDPEKSLSEQPRSRLFFLAFKVANDMNEKSLAVIERLFPGSNNASDCREFFSEVLAMMDHWCEKPAEEPSLTLSAFIEWVRKFWALSVHPDETDFSNTWLRCFPDRQEQGWFLGELMLRLPRWLEALEIQSPELARWERGWLVNGPELGALVNLPVLSNAFSEQIHRLERKPVSVGKWQSGLEKNIALTLLEGAAFEALKKHSQWVGRNVGLLEKEAQENACNSLKAIREDPSSVQDFINHWELEQVFLGFPKAWKNHQVFQKARVLEGLSAAPENQKRARM